jgi:hypothetical protein
VKHSPSFTGQINAEFHFPDSFGQPHENRTANDTVTDVQLGHLGNLGDSRNVLVIQPVAGVELEPCAHGRSRGNMERRQLVTAALALG